MESEASTRSAGKSRKRAGGKPLERPAVPKVKSTIHLSVDASQRLDIHATMYGLDRSALVERLINEHLKRWVVSDRGGPEADGQLQAKLDGKEAAA